MLCFLRVWVQPGTLLRSAAALLLWDIGWLVCTITAPCGSLVYRVGVILDRECPYRVSAAISDSIFSSHEAYEISGLVPNTVFPTGMLLRGDELWVYYGAAGCSICLATIRLSELLDLFG